MLILSRRESETVCLGDDIVLTIVAVGNDKVRVGVKAPNGVRILRTELEVSTLPFNPPPALAPAAGTADEGIITVVPIEPSAPLKAIIMRTKARKADDESHRAA